MQSRNHTETADCRDLITVSWWLTVCCKFVLDSAASRRQISVLDVSVEVMVGGPPGGNVRSGRHAGELRRWKGMLRHLQQQRDIRCGPLSHREPFARVRAGG